MADTAAAINLANGLKADRKLEMIFVNMGTGETEEWELLGRGVEDASVAFNHDTNQTTDILGITDTEVSPAKPELDLDPCTIRGGQKLSAKLLDIERRNAIAELGQFTFFMCTAFSALHPHSPLKSTPTARSYRRALAEAPMSACR